MRRDEFDLSDRLVRIGVRLELLKIQTGCIYCSAPINETNATIEHVVPLDRGGAHRWDNVVLCCFDCNQTKSNRHLVEFMPEAKRDYVEAERSRKIRESRKPVRFRPFDGLARALQATGKMPTQPPARPYQAPRISSRTIGTKQGLRSFTVVEKRSRKPSIA